MSASEWAGLIVSVVTIVASFIGATRWLVKHYLSELRPNSGSSLRDSVDRLENRVDRIYEMLCEK
jgi:predicted transcriptional regulator